MNRNKIIAIHGKNKILHDLDEFDVVFGTKGNGRNEIFLQVLEDHSEKYKQLSKFQKMSLIQQLIRDWRGNFYVLDSKTNELCLVKKKAVNGGVDADHHRASQYHEPEDDIPALSGRLYTSVRRMMNYVITKKQDRNNSGPTTKAAIRTTKRPKKTQAASLPRSKAALKATKSFARACLRMTSVTKASITAPKLNTVLVTPEASPRTFPVSSDGRGSQQLPNSTSGLTSSFTPSPPSITLQSAALGSVPYTSSMSLPQISFDGTNLDSTGSLHKTASDHANNSGVVDQLEVSAISVLLSFSRSV
jgi:hypothetical protein